MTQVRFLDGPPALPAADPDDRCGFDLWLGARGNAWAASTWAGRPRRVEVERGAERASLAFLERRIAPGLTLGSATPYARIEGSAALFWSEYRAIAKAAGREGIARLELSLSGAELERCLACESYADIERARATRQVLDLSAYKSEDAYLAALAANTRWAVRKARRETQVRTATAADVSAIQALYAQTMKDKGAPVNYGADRFASLTAGGALLIGYVGDEPAGMAAAIDGTHVRHLVQLAVPHRFQSSRLADRLAYEMVAAARASGLRWFDFMASGEGDTGVAAFKSKWGGQTEPLEHAAIVGLPLRSALIQSARRWRAGTSGGA